MKKTLLLSILFFTVITGFASAKVTSEKYVNSQISDSTKAKTILKTDNGKVKIPGIWEEFHHAEDSGQHYLKNSEGVIIAIALNPKKNYSFYSSSKTNSELVTGFYKWEYDYRIENGFKTSKIKEGKDGNYIIWKFTEDNIDNVFLYGVKSKLMVNYLVYTNNWSEDQKVAFLEKLYFLNK